VVKKPWLPAARLLPEVVLLDIQMPHINGYDACRHIRGIPGGRVDHDHSRRRDGDRTGIVWTAPAPASNHHLVKPVTPRN
jgi:CheY-like chemotaxis protein